MNGEHVLIADGDSATQSTFTNSFRDDGFAVSTATDAINRRELIARARSIMRRTKASQQA